MDGDQRGEMIRMALAQRVGLAPDASAIAEATQATWEQMSARLVPVIGARGVDALLGRAMHLTRLSFPRLDMAGADGNRLLSFERFKACLESHETSDAVEASCVLLVTFTDVLAALIGDALVERLLSPAWTVSQPSSESENPL